MWAKNMELVTSPNGGSVTERQRLQDRFGERLSVNLAFNRKTVSYQGNRNAAGLRWIKYKEAFSKELVEDFIDEYQPASLLDPFAGIGTAPLVAAGNGISATGIEIMPVGVLAGQAIAQTANGVSRSALESVGNRLVEHIASDESALSEYAFPHVKITESAFPDTTEADIAKARRFIEEIGEPTLRALMNFACMSILEDVSYTRKDGQYLRWDYRSGRSLRSRVDKGPILPFRHALEHRLTQMVQDIRTLKRELGWGYPTLLTGSSLELLRTLPSESFDMVITSPPYANRYDYTRTYALELAWLGYDQADFADLRQQMLSATVENKPKQEWLRRTYGGDSGLLERAQRMYQDQGATREVLHILRQRQGELGNRHVIRLIEGYFFEMAIIVAELGRLVRPGGTVIMVNDNVQYHGEELPVDLILADYAEQSGFVCADIWTLQRGKGNSSQQMRRFGRREIRKCVYRWVRKNE